MTPERARTPTMTPERARTPTMTPERARRRTMTTEMARTGTMTPEGTFDIRNEIFRLVGSIILKYVHSVELVNHLCFVLRWMKPSQVTWMSIDANSTVVMSSKFTNLQQVLIARKDPVKLCQDVSIIASLSSLKCLKLRPLGLLSATPIPPPNASLADISPLLTNRLWTTKLQVLFLDYNPCMARIFLPQFFKKVTFQYLEMLMVGHHYPLGKFALRLTGHSLLGDAVFFFDSDIFNSNK